MNTIKNKITNLRRKVRRFLDPSDFTLPEVISKPQVSHHRRLNIGHICAFTYGNAGDTLLPVTIRDFFMSQWLNIRKWYGMDVHRLVTPIQIRYLNRMDILIIGGGGAILERHLS